MSQEKGNDFSLTLNFDKVMQSIVVEGVPAHDRGPEEDEL